MTSFSSELLVHQNPANDSGGGLDEMWAGFISFPEAVISTFGPRVDFQINRMESRTLVPGCQIITCSNLIAAMGYEMAVDVVALEPTAIKESNDCRKI